MGSFWFYHHYHYYHHDSGQIIIIHYCNLNLAAIWGWFPKINHGSRGRENRFRSWSNLPRLLPSGYLTYSHGKWPIYRWFTIWLVVEPPFWKKSKVVNGKDYPIIYGKWNSMVWNHQPDTHNSPLLTSIDHENHPFNKCFKPPTSHSSGASPMNEATSRPWESPLPPGLLAISA